MSPQLPAHLLAPLSAFVASRMGLHFPRERWTDLSNGLSSAAHEQGLMDAEKYGQQLLSAPPTRREVENLARHLTVGETYFFREKGSFDALEGRVLPEILSAHRARDMRLRIWSAGCCTGEEPYSVAMLLDRLLPDADEWNITILATDVNPRFLEIAAAGVYGEWSFRAMPPGFRERYFVPVHGRRMQLSRRIRRKVTFGSLNLAEDSYPSLVNNTNAMDLVLCRNVLMYFTPEHAARLVANLGGALVERGWLLVAPSETSQSLFRDFATVSFPDAVFYRRLAGSSPKTPSSDVMPLERPEPCVMQEGQTKAAAPIPTPAPKQFPLPISMARALANAGELTQALAWCDRAVSQEPFNPACRFLRAMVAQELGRLDDAMRFVREALYLDQDFIMAHCAMGNLALRLGRRNLSRRHFQSALSLLERLGPDELVPESDGLTAGRLTAVILPVSEAGGDDP